MGKRTSDTAALPPRDRSLWRILKGPTPHEMCDSLRSGGEVLCEMVLFAIQMVRSKEPNSRVRYAKRTYTIHVRIWSLGLGMQPDDGWRFTGIVDETVGDAPDGLGGREIQGEWDPNVKKGTLK